MPSDGAAAANARSAATIGAASGACAKAGAANRIRGAANRASCRMTNLPRPRNATRGACLVKSSKDQPAVLHSRRDETRAFRALVQRLNRQIAVGVDADVGGD